MFTHESNAALAISRGDAIPRCVAPGASLDVHRHGELASVRQEDHSAVVGSGGEAFHRPARSGLVRDYAPGRQQCFDARGKSDARGESCSGLQNLD